MCGGTQRCLAIQSTRSITRIHAIAVAVHASGTPPPPCLPPPDSSGRGTFAAWCRSAERDIHIRPVPAPVLTPVLTPVPTPVCSRPYVVPPARLFPPPCRANRGALHVGQWGFGCDAVHLSMHGAWNACPHGSNRSLAGVPRGARQIAHSIRSTLTDGRTERRYGTPQRAWTTSFIGPGTRVHTSLGSH